MRKILIILTISLSIIIINQKPSHAFFGLFDPTVSGCVYQEPELGNKKIHCVSIKYNESKNPGSLKKAERACYRELNYYGRKYGEIGYWISGCLP